MKNIRSTKSVEELDESSSIHQELDLSFNSSIWDDVEKKLIRSVGELNDFLNTNPEFDLSDWNDVQQILAIHTTDEASFSVMHRLEALLRFAEQKSIQLNLCDIAKSQYGQELILLAAEFGNSKIIELLLEHGVNIDTQNQAGYTPLRIAINNNQNSIVDVLLEHKADVHIPSKSGNTPICIAVQRGNYKCVQLLLIYGANANDKDSSGSSLLRLAIRKSNKAIIKLLLDDGADVYAKSGGETVLHTAAAQSDPEIVQWLLDKVANINEYNQKGYTPLRVAINSGNINIVKLFLERGVDPNIPSKSGTPPFCIAAGGKVHEIVQLLLKYGANVNDKDANNRTPLLMALDKGNKKILKLLLLNGANVNIPDKHGTLPLQIAIGKGDEEIIQWLLYKGADVKLKNSSGITPLETAINSGKINIVKLLVPYVGKSAEEQDQELSMISSQDSLNNQLFTFFSNALTNKTEITREQFKNLLKNIPQNQQEKQIVDAFSKAAHHAEDVNIKLLREVLELTFIEYQQADDQLFTLLQCINNININLLVLKELNELPASKSMSATKEAKTNIFTSVFQILVKAKDLSQSLINALTLILDKIDSNQDLDIELIMSKLEESCTSKSLMSETISGQLPAKMVSQLLAYEYHNNSSAETLKFCSKVAQDFILFTIKTNNTEEFNNFIYSIAQIDLDFLFKHVITTNVANSCLHYLYKTSYTGKIDKNSNAIKISKDLNILLSLKDAQTDRMRAEKNEMSDVGKVYSAFRKKTCDWYEKKCSSVAKLFIPDELTTEGGKKVLPDKPVTIEESFWHVRAGLVIANKVMSTFVCAYPNFEDHKDFFHRQNGLINSCISKTQKFKDQHNLLLKLSSASVSEYKKYTNFVLSTFKGLISDFIDFAMLQLSHNTKLDSEMQLKLEQFAILAASVIDGMGASKFPLVDEVMCSKGKAGLDLVLLSLMYVDNEFFKPVTEAIYKTYSVKTIFDHGMWQLEQIYQFILKITKEEFEGGKTNMQVAMREASDITDEQATRMKAKFEEYIPEISTEKHEMAKSIIFGLTYLGIKYGVTNRNHLILLSNFFDLDKIDKYQVVDPIKREILTDFFKAVNYFVTNKADLLQVALQKAVSKVEFSAEEELLLESKKQSLDKLFIHIKEEVDKKIINIARIEEAKENPKVAAEIEEFKESDQPTQKKASITDLKQPDAVEFTSDIIGDVEDSGLD